MSQFFVTSWTAACQASLSFTISWSLLKLMSIESVMPSNHLILCCLFLLLSFFPSIRVFFNEVALPSGGQRFGVSASAWGLPMNIQDWLIWSPCSPRDSQESSSPAPEIKGINSSVLSLFYGPALTSVHDYWKNHSFDYTDLCRQSGVSAF